MVGARHWPGFGRADVIRIITVKNGCPDLASSGGRGRAHGERREPLAELSEPAPERSEPSAKSSRRPAERDEPASAPNPAALIPREGSQFEWRQGC